MERITWDTYFLKMAHVAKLRSADIKRQVGCVLVSMKDNKLISTGFNGLPAGIPESTIVDWDDREAVHRLIIHAEANSLLYAKSNFEDSILYGTLSPCTGCVKLLAAARVKRVVYTEDYRDIEESKKLCEIFGIELQKYNYPV
jgi:dCMP deaminase